RVPGVDGPERGNAGRRHGAFAYRVRPVGATQLYLRVVNNLQRRSLEMRRRASLARLEGMVAERVDQMRRAAELQAGMLPASPLKEDGVEGAAHLTPARAISGESYDWYRGPNGRLAVPLGELM